MNKTKDYWNKRFIFSNKVKMLLIFKTEIVTLLAAAAKLLQSCLTLCNPMDSSPPGSAVHRILQIRILEWVAISFSSLLDRAVLEISFYRVFYLKAIEAPT